MGERDERKSIVVRKREIRQYYKLSIYVSGRTIALVFDLVELVIPLPDWHLYNI